MFKVLGKIFELQSFQFEASKRKIKKKEKGEKKKENVQASFLQSLKAFTMFSRP